MTNSGAISLKKLLMLSIFVWTFASAYTQSKPFVTKPEQLSDPRFAEWVSPEEATGVFCFRKQMELAAVPERFIVHVSADARFRLYINGSFVSWGPAVGDVENWNYETIDIAPFLKPGRNILAAQVWSWGAIHGARQQSLRAAFILQGESSVEQIANTNKTWKVQKDKGYSPLTMTDKKVGGGYIAGVTDSIDTRLQPYGWVQPAFDDSQWMQATELGKGNHSGLDTWRGTAWKLKPREIPLMEQKEERTLNLLHVSGIPKPEKTNGKLNLTVPANTHVELLFDNGVLTMGFPQLIVSGGKDSQIKVQYQEALFGTNGKKENRNEWEGKQMKGCYDVFIADGNTRLLQPLWIRTFRYVKICVDTRSNPLVLQDFYNKFTAYPLQQKGSFYAANDNLMKIWDASWRTARLCALETYMDCPYYEQLQYIGDTRIQALISMYVAGDNRLARNAIQQIYASMQPMGLTKSAHPTSGVQIIPPFALHYIGMIHDYYMLNNDRPFIGQFVPGIKFMLEWFISRIDSTGMLGPLPYWNHIDGGTGFANGSPPGVSEGGSANITLLLAHTLDVSAEMLADFGYTCDADRFKSIAAGLKKKTFERCFSDEKGLIAETPARQSFSQHTNVFGILADAFPANMQKAVAQRILDDKSLIKTTLYFKFYLFQALKKAGLGGEVISLMSDWTAFLNYGLSTFPEHGINSRSDCHAWAAHPIYDFLNITCGVESVAPGFQKVAIRPELGPLPEIKGEVAHPLGNIVVHCLKKGDKISAEVSLPQGLTGSLFINGQKYALHEGTNHF